MRAARRLSFENNLGPLEMTNASTGEVVDVLSITYA